MRIFRSILFIFCLAGPYLAIFVYLKNEKRALKSEIKHALMEVIDRSELVELTFSTEETKTELRWEHSEEFEYRGEMYDVVETETNGNQITYWVWWDHAETSLNKRLNSLLIAMLGQTNGPERNDPIAGFLKLLYVLPDNSCCPGVGISSEKTAFTFLQAASHIQPEPTGPPPQV